VNRDDAGDRRWWLDPALARLAFGADTRIGSGRPSQSIASAMASVLEERAELDEGDFAIDLDDPAQRSFGGYELLELIGRGGMGVVYRARQHKLEREVAIKLLSAGSRAPSDLVESLRREARHAARLQHPNIVAVHEMGEHGGLIFFAMQLVRGPSLSQRIDTDGPLPARQAARLLRTIAEAVDYAHRFGVLHLDLKPGNVLLDEDDTPLIADFGLARRLEQEFERERISGTPGYMAPEQASNDGPPLSPATDVWALGAMLYEMLTGLPPFHADSTVATIELLLHADVAPPPRSARVPPDLEAICLHCLQKDRARRYPSARALADDLGRFLEGRAVGVRPSSVPRRLIRWARREPQLATVTGFALLVLVAGIVATTAQWQRAESAAVAAREQTWDTRSQAAWRLIEAGRYVESEPLLRANLAERERQNDAAGVALERLRLDSLHHSNATLTATISTGAPGFAVALDRTGQRVAASVGAEQLRLYDVHSGRERWRADLRQASHFWPVDALYRVSFTRDGRHLIADRGEPGVITAPAGHDNILVDAATGLVRKPPKTRFLDFRDATYSADGRFALLRNTRHQVQLFRVADWQPLSPLRSFTTVHPMWCLGDDARFIATSVMTRLELWDPHSLRSRYTLSMAPDNAIMAWAPQPGGWLLALGGMDGKVQLLDTQTLRLKVLEPAPYRRIDSLAFSDDGRWLAAVSAGHAFVWDVATGTGGALPPMRNDRTTRIQVDAASATVFAVGPPEATLWHLPEGGTPDADLRQRVTAAQPLAPQLAAGTALQDYAAAYAPAARLAASIDGDGNLRLWRWQGWRPLRARSAPSRNRELIFDGSHVASVDGRMVRVLAVDGERAASPAFVHPQPVSLAELAPDGQALVTVSGREIRVIDWRRGRLRFAPIMLAASPLRIAIAPDAGTLLATTGGYRNGRFHELLSSYDLRSGKAAAIEVPTPGPLAGLRYAPTGRSLVHWRHGQATVREVPSLRAVGKRIDVGPDIAEALRRRYLTGGKATDETQLRGTPLSDAALSLDANRLEAITRTSSYTNAQLLQFDVRSGRRLATRDLGKRQPLRLLAYAGGYELPASAASGSRWLDSGNGDRPLPKATGRLRSPVALSPDGRWLASVSDGGVLLADRRTHQWASTALVPQLPLGDAIAQVAFANDGTGLLARSHQGRWLWWPLTARTQRANAIASVSAAVSLPTTVAPEPGYGFVDLHVAANRGVDAGDIVHDDEIGTFATVPTGVQRFLGIDYRIDRIIALSQRSTPASPSPLPWASKPVDVPIPRFAAVHLLLGACCMLQGRPHADYAFMDIHYVDGGTARVPIQYHWHLWEPWDDPGDALPARTAWVETAPRPYIHFKTAFRLYGARLANPHPQRSVASLSFETNDLAWTGLLVFAATVEAAGTASEVARR
jgi:WD40 repeat protein/tRNA A-37 threonylcarbamoyl transferase component Bud32